MQDEGDHIYHAPDIAFLQEGATLFSEGHVTCHFKLK